MNEGKGILGLLKKLTVSSSLYDVSPHAGVIRRREGWTGKPEG
jgi:hypothetical protein